MKWFRRPLHRWSISVRLTLWYVTTLLVVLGLFAAFSYAAFHMARHRDFDQHLIHETRQIMPFVQERAGMPVFVALDTLRSVAYQTDGIYGTYVRLLRADGSVVYESPNFARHELLPVRVQPVWEVQVYSHAWEGKPARTRYTPLFAEGGRLFGWLEVTGFEWSLHRELHHLGLVLGLGIVLGVLLAAVGGYWLARRALQPVALLTATARQMGADNLEARLPVPSGVQDELTELAQTFNELLTRLAASLERERRFTDNAAHELLTPLSALRSELEVALRRPRQVVYYREVLEEALRDVERMTETVRGLLHLARLERTDAHERARPTYLVERYRSRLKDWQVRLKQAELRFDAVLPEHAWVCAVPEYLDEVLDNLLSNACKYTPPGGHVRVEVHQLNGQVRLRISDSGVGFTPEEAAHLFDRFYRGSSAEGKPGSGLGLAIVRAIVQACGGSVRAWSPGPGKGSTFEVYWPACAVSMLPAVQGRPDGLSKRSS
jgi:signal transduction histidine kinase